MLVSQSLVELVVGSEYGGSGTLFATLLPNVLCGGLAVYYAGIRLVSLNKNREYLIAVTIGAVLNVGLNLIAIPLWGGIGAAITTCLSQAAVAGVGAWFGRRHEGPRLLADATFPLAASICMVVVLKAAMAMFPGLHVLGIVLAGAVIYGLLWGLARAGNFA
jgi:O-antigen/teichoic acid export membrane protein